MVERGLWYRGEYGIEGIVVERGLWYRGDYGIEGTMV